MGIVVTGFPHFCRAQAAQQIKAMEHDKRRDVFRLDYGYSPRRLPLSAGVVGRTSVQVMS